MILDSIKYSYNDLTIVPAVTSKVNSRKQVNPYYDGDKLPIFTAPMSTVVCPANVEQWERNGITPIIPRNVNYNHRLNWLNMGKWVAFSLNEAIKIFIDEKMKFDTKIHLCIDIANGHMEKLINTCRLIKFNYKDKISIMTGNIANPETIKVMNGAGIDYVRCGIGGGAGCSTTSNTGTHYPMASLIDECFNIKKKYNLRIKIIADGGIRNFNHVNIALALGADYVMIGSIFASFFESAALFQGYKDYKINDHKLVDGAWKITEINQLDPKLDEEIKRRFLSYGQSKEFYGMSTKKAQSLIKPDGELKTAEGVHKILKSEYTIKQWVDNMTDYLRSVMSYTNKFDIKDFIGNVNLVINSISEIQAVNK